MTHELGTPQPTRNPRNPPTPVRWRGKRAPSAVSKPPHTPLWQQLRAARSEMMMRKDFDGIAQFVTARHARRLRLPPPPIASSTFRYSPRGSLRGAGGSQGARQNTQFTDSRCRRRALAQCAKHAACRLRPHPSRQCTSGGGGAAAAGSSST